MVLGEYINDYVRRQAFVTGAASKLTLPASPRKKAGLFGPGSSIGAMHC